MSKLRPSSLSIPSLFSIFFLSCNLFTTANAVATCYDSSLKAKDVHYRPCNETSEFSMCCRLDEVGGYGADTCLPNGLCTNIPTNSIDPQTYWRESCSDPTWKSPYCLTALNACSEVSGSQDIINKRKINKAGREKRRKVI